VSCQIACVCLAEPAAVPLPRAILLADDT